jgi:hypothetical protein
MPDVRRVYFSFNHGMQSMRFAIRVAVVFVAFSALAVVAASALPPLPQYLEDYYATSPEHVKYLEMYKGLEAEHKCDACHKPGVDKKAKGHGLNDYGDTIHKHFKHRDFNKADKLGKDNAEEAAKARKIVADALEKAAAEKNAEGRTFGELIKAGQLPGKN